LENALLFLWGEYQPMSLGGKNIKCKINAKGAKIKPKRVHGVSSSSGEGGGMVFGLLY
jgi:hypothetical protein